MSPIVLANVTRAVNAFWFGPADDPAFGRPRDVWFQKNAAFDAEIRARFAAMVDAAGAGALDMMAESPEGAVALVVALDQFPRNLYRGDARAFAFDAKARAIADSALAKGFDGAVMPVMRTFLYLPFEHSEDMADQDRAVALFTELGEPQGLDYAERHRDIIRRFGRFPHRNAALGRESTPEELEFLEQPGSSF